eukprot:3491274-Amphidinium_carterae.2
MDENEETKQLEIAQDYLQGGTGKRHQSERARLASWKWIVALDNQLRFTWHTGLRAFVLPGYDWKQIQLVPNVPLSSPPPVLSICADQCSSQLSPTYYLQYQLGLMLVFLHDVSHRQSNDMLNSIREAGFVASGTC